MIERSYATAAEWHQGQRRRSGDPYVTHPLAVAQIVADLGMDHHTVCAALLHDLLEDTEYPADRLAGEFGPDIADLVAAVSDATAVQQALTALNAAPAAAISARDRAVLVLKLADRLHNMRTVRFLDRARQHVKAQQTLDLQAPVADALGLDQLSGELRRLSSAALPSADCPATLCRQVLAVTTLLLPTAARTRWLQEWTGELGALPTCRARMCFTVHIIVRMPHLALILRRPRPGSLPW
ncbi:HD domain-containing protein [Streptomyces sp. H39-S7]|uniref:HD domain-containing protein n=1 Tax=Streptomyces sp. H39-S7 TaxID=3004357 RepID=UPI0022AF436E|nr:HD domain-containing protein [Streptomyces sp. H39-S7]MCZ4126174.1 HD domain-containing protein [Streptomyces sp. H39-S7]